MAPLRPILVVFGGLRGTGKTAVAQALAAKLALPAYRRYRVGYKILRGVSEIGVAGCTVANALAEANLRLGISVVATSVNPRFREPEWMEANSSTILSTSQKLRACALIPLGIVDGSRADQPTFPVTFSRPGRRDEACVGAVGWGAPYPGRVTMSLTDVVSRPEAYLLESPN